MNRDTQTVVGVEINCNHLRSTRDGWVHGKATPIKLGRKIQVWNIEIKNDDEKMVDYPIKDENGQFLRFERMSKREIENIDRMEDRLARYPWRSDPVTEKQLAELESYGHKEPMPRTKGAASDLIKKYREEELGF